VDVSGHELDCQSLHAVVQPDLWVVPVLAVVLIEGVLLLHVPSTFVVDVRTRYETLASVGTQNATP
jgi:hypothetical protein